jgi:hypothetical protein
MKLFILLPLSHSTELSLTLKTLRLLVREPEGTQSLFQRAALLRIMELAALSDHSPSSIPPSLTTTTTTTTTTTETNTNTNKLLDVEEEALKCLVNITLRSEAARQEFIVLNGPKYLVTRLPQYMSTITTPDARLLFALIRLIVVLTTPNKENINPITTTLLNLKILPLLVELLHRTVTDSTLFPSHCPPHLHEILKALFNLTFDMGPLGSGTLHYESFLPNFQLYRLSLSLSLSLFTNDNTISYTHPHTFSLFSHFHRAVISFHFV